MAVAVVGAAVTQFGERDASRSELLVEAGRACLDDAAVPPDAVDHLYVARSSGDYGDRKGMAPAVAADLGLSGHAVGIDQTSAAGGAAVYAAWRSVESGESEASLVIGGEKMTDRSTSDLTDRLSAITHPVEYKHGITMPSFAGLAARAYLDRFDAPRESLARVAVKNHRHGTANPKAHFQREVDLETVLDSPIVADPLRLYDFCPISDGSAALLVTTEERARELTARRTGRDRYARLAGVAGATGRHVVHQRPDLTAIPAVARAGERAYERAGIGPEDVDVAELHDMFTILEPLQMEGLGLADRGEAWRHVDAGRTEIGGELPINTSGGLKSKGHPIAASGVAQAVEIYEQLTGSAGPRQVDADVGLTCNVGGFGNCAVVSVLERGE